MPGKRALITGISGQDGAYLAQFLLGKGYQVYGACRASSCLWRLQELGIDGKVETRGLDLLDTDSVGQFVRDLGPDEIYHLAAQSFIGDSYENPVYTGDLNGLGVVRLLEAVRRNRPECRLFVASSAELFGPGNGQPLSEASPILPNNPYAVAKAYAYWMTGSLRQHYGLFACSGILFNHESPLRGQQFVTRKITSGLARCLYADGPPVRLGNLAARRDWSYAGDFVRGMWLMLQHSEPQDYVLAGGEARSVREFAEAAARGLGLTLTWQRHESGEVALDQSGRVVFESDGIEREDVRIGDPAKARQLLGWRRETDFDKLVSDMVQADRERILQRSPLRG